MNQQDLFNLHKETTSRCFKICEEKNNDYANSDNPFKNFESSTIFGIHPVKGILLRITDKLQRVNTFCENGQLSVKTESVDDALEDVINYCILAKGIIKKSKEKCSTTQK